MVAYYVVLYILLVYVVLYFTDTVLKVSLSFFLFTVYLNLPSRTSATFRCSSLA